MKYKGIKCPNCEKKNTPYLEHNRYWYECTYCGTKLLLKNLRSNNEYDKDFKHEKNEHIWEYRDNEIKELNAQ